jgi:FtsZ-binding cell division protein ZapB
MNNNEYNKVIVYIGNDDIYFIMGDKETSVLKMIEKLDKKIGKFALGSWIAIGLAIILAFPAALFQVGLIEIKEQNQVLDKQNQALDRQNETLDRQNESLKQQLNILENRLIVLETQINK